VLINAIKELPNIPLESLLKNWNEIGVKFAWGILRGVENNLEDYENNPIVPYLKKNDIKLHKVKF